jgi:hypothetical protein
LRRFVLVFFDDILIYSSSWAEHLQHIAVVLNELRAHSLHLKRSKCSFGAPSVAYLGHVISAEGVAMDADKAVVDPNSHGGSCEGEGGNDRRWSGTPDDGGARLWVAPPVSSGAVRDGNASVVGAVFGGGGEPVSRARNSRNSVRRASIALP